MASPMFTGYMNQVISNRTNLKLVFILMQLKSVVHPIKFKGCRLQCSITRDGRVLAVFTEEKKWSRVIFLLTLIKVQKWTKAYSFSSFQNFPQEDNDKSPNKECSAGLATEITCVGKKKKKSDKNLTSRFGKGQKSNTNLLNKAFSKDAGTLLNTSRHSYRWKIKTSPYLKAPSILTTHNCLQKQKHLLNILQWGSHQTSSSP